MRNSGEAKVLISMLVATVRWTTPWQQGIALCNQGTTVVPDSSSMETVHDGITYSLMFVLLHLSTPIIVICFRFGEDVYGMVTNGERVMQQTPTEVARDKTPVRSWRSATANGLFRAAILTNK